MIDNLIERWVDVIDKPIAINKKQGFVLNNGMRIILNKLNLSYKSNEILKRHYKRKGIINDSNSKTI